MSEPGTIYQMAEASQFANGQQDTAHPPPPSGPRERQRVEWLDLPADSEYAEFKVKAWTNYPQRLMTELGSNEPERVRPALQKIVLEHNGWIDQEGEPYPLASSPDFWEAISQSLYMVTVATVVAAASKLPNSLDPRKRR